MYKRQYGDKPSNSGNGMIAKISKIVTTDPTIPYPAHITTLDGGALGWCAKDSLQVVKNE